jgi:hypothetical protein
MILRRSKSVAAWIVGVAAVSTAVIVAGVIYRGAVDAEHARVLHVQAVSENRWERQAADVLHSTVKSTMKALDQPIIEAQAIYDSTAGRASDEAREALKNAIAAAKNAPPKISARVDPLTGANDLSVASEGTMKLVSTLKGNLVTALKVPQEQAVAFDAAAEAKRIAAETAAARKKVTGVPVSGGGGPASEAGKKARALCLQGGGGTYDGATACVKAMAYGVTVSVEWDSKSGSGWWGYTSWNTGTLTASVSLSTSIGTDWGSSPQAVSVAMHESGHASNARCPAVADDPVFNQRSSRDKREERFATAYAIAYGAPDRDAAGQSAYDFVSTDAEIEAAKRC